MKRKRLLPILIVYLIAFFLVNSISVKGQNKNCISMKPRFPIRKITHADTLGDLIIKKNWYKIYKGYHNTIILNKPFSKLKNFKIEGAQVCPSSTDSIIFIMPEEKFVKFSYKYKGHHFVKIDSVDYFNESKIIACLDNRVQQPDLPLLNYRTIDSLSFKVEENTVFKSFPKEDFKLAVNVNIYLLRNRKVITSAHFPGGDSFYINDILILGIPGDQLSVEFQPEYANEYRRNNYRFSCSGGLVRYTLGLSK